MTTNVKFGGTLNVELFLAPYSQGLASFGLFDKNCLLPMNSGLGAANRADGSLAFTAGFKTTVFQPGRVTFAGTTLVGASSAQGLSSTIIGSNYCISQLNFSGPNLYGKINWLSGNIPAVLTKSQAAQGSPFGGMMFPMCYSIPGGGIRNGAMQFASFFNSSFNQGTLFDPTNDSQLVTGRLGGAIYYAGFFGFFGGSVSSQPEGMVPLHTLDSATGYALNSCVVSTGTQDGSGVTGPQMRFGILGLNVSNLNTTTMNNNIFYDGGNVQFDDAVINAALAGSNFSVSSNALGYIFNVPNYGRFFADPFLRTYFRLNIFTRTPGKTIRPPTLFASETKIDEEGILYFAPTDVATGVPGNVMTSFKMTLPWQTLTAPQIQPLYLDCYSNCLGKNSPQAKI
jgi:hypothetical protein